MMKKFVSGCLFFLIFSSFLLTAQSKGDEGDVHFHSLGYVAEGCWKFYHKFITAQDASRCPYELSCSKYMVESVKLDGLFGFIEGFDRLNRCSRYEKKNELYNRTENGRFDDEAGDIKRKSIELQNYLLKSEAVGLKKKELKSRKTATALSLIVPGAGQIYLGNYGRGARDFFVTGLFAGAAVWSSYKYGTKNWRPWVYGTMAAGSWIVDVYGAGSENVLQNYAAVFGTDIENAAGGEPEPSEEDFDARPESAAGADSDLSFSGKSVTTARILSIIPGMGQLYAHQWKDGINAFLLDGALIAVSAYSLFTLNFVDFFVLEINPALRFYRGNFINAEKNVIKFNKSQQQKHVEPVY